MHIICQRYNGKRGLYTSAPTAAKSRPTWEPISGCEYLVLNNGKGGPPKKVFQFRNTDGDRAKFRADTMIPLLTEVTPFTQKMAALLVSNPKLLASYFSLLSFSKKFSNFNSEEYEENGMKKDGSGLVEESLVTLGGSVGDYMDFALAAHENVAEVSSMPGVKMSPASKKRKLTDYFGKTEQKKKMSKSEVVEDNFRAMVTEEGGLEKSVSSSYVNFQSISLDKLALSPDLFMPIIIAKVDELVESMLARLDPSQLVISVVPSDLARFDKEGCDDKFWVVHGQHRFEAVKKMDAINQTKAIAGFPQDRSILCYIIRVSAPSLTNYLNIKSNDIAFEFQTKASNESLFFVYKGLVVGNSDPAESLAVIEKIGHSRRSSPSDLTVYRKVTQWPPAALDSLLSVLEKFMVFQTKDAKARGVKTKIKHREANTLTSAMFKQLGCCSPQFFQERSQAVLENKMSLRELLESSEKFQKVTKCEEKILLCAGNVQNIDTLKDQYPDKFTPEVIEQYTGSEIMGKKRNPLGLKLRSYVKSVLSGNTFEDSVKIEAYEHCSDLGAKRFDGFDVCVLNVGKKNIECVKCWVDTLCCSLKESYAVFLILESPEYLVDIFVWLDTWKDKPDFQIRQCIFKKDKSAPDPEQFNTNATFVVLFGKINIYTGRQILALNGVIENELKEMVSKVTPPGGKVAYLSTGACKVIPVHKVLPVVEDKTSDVEVTYIVTKKEVKRMKKMLLLPLADLGARSRLNEREISSRNEKKDDDSGTEEESDSDVSNTGDEEEEATETGLTEDGEEVSELSSLVREPSTSCTKYC